MDGQRQAVPEASAWGQWTGLELQLWHLLGGWPRQVTEHAKPRFLFCKKRKNRIYRMICF